MFWLAFKTLFRDRGRLVITLIGVIFSATLTLIEVGIYLGMMGNATALIRNTDADIWVVAKNTQTTDFASPFPADRIRHVRSLPNIASSDRILFLYGFIKLKNGTRDQLQIVAYNPDTGIGGPWTMKQGTPADVKGGQYMIVDATSEQRLGTLDIGTLWEITLSKEHAFKLVGLSNGIKSFTTMPMAFIAYNEAEALLAEFGWEGLTFFIVAKVKEPAEQEAIVATLQKTLTNNDVLTRDAFIKRTVRYWTIQTGMGAAFLITALLATLIGGIIVGQTIYAGTMEHLGEYGTLKAIGASNGDIYKVIFTQAGVGGIMGYGLSVFVVLFLREGIEQAGVPLFLPPLLFWVVFPLIIGTCLSAAFMSVHKVRTLDPVTVFRIS